VVVLFRYFPGVRIAAGESVIAVPSDTTEGVGADHPLAGKDLVFDVTVKKVEAVKGVEH